MDLVESHDAQKYGYIFLYLLIHTRIYIELNPGSINKEWRHKCQNINDAKDKSYSVIRQRQVYVIHKEGGVTTYMYQEY